MSLPDLALLPLSIPSPPEGVWYVGPIPLRAYALAIILGVVAAVWLGGRRWEARGGRREDVADVALWAVPAGVIGARIYHVATDHQLYFGEGRNPLGALEIWNGGLGIWGAISGGFLGAWFACRRRGIRILPFADALAPGLLLAQAIGRLGNYFNQELFGRPTTLPWGLEISPVNRPSGYEQFATFHPTFLYELLWNLAGVALIIALDRRLRLDHGRVFALYVMVYTAGRGWIEMLRIDTIELDDVGGLRWGVWMSVVLFTLAALYFLLARRRQRGQDDRADVYREGRRPEPVSGSQDDGAPGGADTDEAGVDRRG